MHTLLGQVKPRRQGSVRSQITLAVREMVLDGRLKPGDRLPSSQLLAELWSAPAPTIQRALTPLVKEGLLDRTPRVGTYVRQREQRLLSVGIYASGSLWRSPVYAFGRALCTELHGQLLRAEVEESIWVDPRPGVEQGEPWDELVQAADKRRFQVLIVPTTDDAHRAWLDGLNVPVVYLTAANIHNRVTLDSRQWAAEALQLLAAQGARRVGVICPIRRPVPGTPQTPTDHRLFYAALLRQAARLGLALRPEWLKFCDHDLVNHAVEASAFGHASLRALWGQRRRPDAIAVPEDTVASGVLMAIMQAGIRVPEDLRLVLHRNAEVGLFCPVPAAFVDVHIAEVAAALITQAERLFSGKTVRTISVSHHPVPVGQAWQA